MSVSQFGVFTPPSDYKILNKALTGPIVSKNCVFIGDGTMLGQSRGRGFHSFDALSGVPIDYMPFEGTVVAPPTISDGFLYIPITEADGKYKGSLIKLD